MMHLKMEMGEKLVKNVIYILVNIKPAKQITTEYTLYTRQEDTNVTNVNLTLPKIIPYFYWPSANVLKTLL